MCVYSWEVKARSGPGPKDPSSIIWIYHSHHSEVQDTITGLYGAMIISGQVGQIYKCVTLWAHPSQPLPRALCHRHCRMHQHVSSQCDRHARLAGPGSRHPSALCCLLCACNCACVT